MEQEEEFEGADHQYIKAKASIATALVVDVETVFISWFSKTLQNWKALGATNEEGDNRYVEVTYNGDKKETYIDVYHKQENYVIPDEGY